MADNVELTQWFADLEIELPQVPPSVIRSKLVSTIDRLCSHTRVWRYEHPAITPQVSVSTYDLIPPEGSRVAGVLYLEQNGREVYPRSVEYLRKYVQSWRTVTNVQATSFYMPTRSSFRVVPIPTTDSVANVYTVDVYLAPARDVSSVPGWLFESYFDVVLDGARSLLFSMPKVPWTDRAEGRRMKDLFEEGVRKVLTEQQQGGGLDAVVVDAVPFGGILEI